jgi:hypothetical protein
MHPPTALPPQNVCLTQVVWKFNIKSHGHLSITHITKNVNHHFSHNGKQQCIFMPLCFAQIYNEGTYEGEVWSTSFLSHVFCPNLQ